MRMSFASLAALAALAFAAPAFAQTETPEATPTAKPKPGTAAYCNTLKSTSSKTACLKRVHAQTTPKAAPVKTAKTTKTTKGKKPAAPVAAEATPMTPAPTPAPTQSAAAPATHTPPQTIQVPPLPQKTI